jgi:hypothetical protein
MFTALMPILRFWRDFLFLLPDEDQRLQIFQISWDITLYDRTPKRVDGSLKKGYDFVSYNGEKVSNP